MCSFNDLDEKYTYCLGALKPRPVGPSVARFEGEICFPTASVRMLLVSTLPAKVLGMLYCMSFSQSSTRMSKFSTHFVDGALSLIQLFYLLKG